MACESQNYRYASGGRDGVPEKRQVKIEVSPSRKTVCSKMGKLLRWLKKMKVNERISVEWGPPCSTATKRREKYLPYQEFHRMENRGQDSAKAGHARVSHCG